MNNTYVVEIMLGLLSLGLFISYVSHDVRLQAVGLDLCSPPPTVYELLG